MQGAALPDDPCTALWATGIFVCCLAILATVNIGSPRKWRVLRQAALRLRVGTQALREEADAGDRAVLGLLAVAVAALSMLLWQATVTHSAEEAPSFLHFFIGTAVVMAAPTLLLRLIALLARADAGISEYLHTGKLLHAAVGIAILPLTMLAAYQAPWRAGLILTGLAILGVAIMYRWLRGARIGLDAGVPMRFVLLYLCAAEIGPLLIALNALRNSPLLHS